MLEHLQEFYAHVSGFFEFDVLDLIGRYGPWFYPLTVIWTFLEGETFLIFAGYAASLGLLDFSILVACAWAGSFAGDQLWFILGRRYGQHLLQRFPRWIGGIETALMLARKYNTAFILSFRFIYGIRNVSSFALGMSGLKWLRYLVLNLIAAGLWAITFAGAGHLFGQASQAVLGNAARNFSLLMLAVFICVAWFVVMLHRRHRRKLAEAESTTQR
ncbi:MAG TPA: DedA family protein [Candidatus Cybelea sp.]|nr:DedA family protein [Candidatus Cybelea sp.]